jgi:uncharacterized membrane protein YoaK (UPF0700 family)
MHVGRSALIYLMLRIGVAFVFIYPAIAALTSPIEWVGYLPDFILSAPVNEFVVLHIVGAIEVIIALWILSGRQIFIPSVAGSVILFGIVVLNLSQFEVIFRDVGLLAMTGALAVWSYDKEHKIVGV